MRGAGRQLLATASNAIVYWAGCWPLALALAPRAGVAGLWIALAAATTLQACRRPPPSPGRVCSAALRPGLLAS
jgi:Na+-driven multidrug efflux pump